MLEKVAERDANSILPISGDGLRIMRKERTVLDVEQIHLGEPGVTAILGPNGAGKTLLLRTLTGLIRPDTGQVDWSGKRPSRKRYARLGLILQKPVLLRRSALANIVFALRAAGAAAETVHTRAISVLEHARLTAVAKTPARQLSGGEQQRLALARALCLEPEILFLDEPTASLDPASTLAIEETVKATAGRRVPVVLVTHDIAQARRLADRIMFMHDGRILECGTAGAFFDHPETSQAKAYLAGEIIV